MKLRIEVLVEEAINVDAGKGVNEARSNRVGRRSLRRDGSNEAAADSKHCSNIHRNAHNVNCNSLSWSMVSPTVSSLLRALHPREATLRLTMASHSNGHLNGLASTRTITALSRWSVAYKTLPGKTVLLSDNNHARMPCCIDLFSFYPTSTTNRSVIMPELPFLSAIWPSMDH